MPHAYGKRQFAAVTNWRFAAVTDRRRLEAVANTRLFAAVINFRRFAAIRCSTTELAALVEYTSLQETEGRRSRRGTLLLAPHPPQPCGLHVLHEENSGSMRPIGGGWKPQRISGGSPLVPIGNQRRSPPSLIKRRFAAVTDRWQSEAVTDTRLFAAVTNLWQLAAKLWHRAVRVSMFCPDGEMRLFCFDEKSSLNIYSLATTAWRSAYSVVRPWWLAASSYKKKMYFR